MGHGDADDSSSVSGDEFVRHEPPPLDGDDTESDTPQRNLGPSFVGESGPTDAKSDLCASDGDTGSDLFASDGDSGCDLFASDGEEVKHETRHLAADSKLVVGDDVCGPSESCMGLLWDLDNACGEDFSCIGRLCGLLLSARVLHEEDYLETSVIADQVWVSDYYDLPDEDDDGSNTHPWVLRLEVGASGLAEAGINVGKICRVLTAKARGHLHIIYSELLGNARSQMIRIRVCRAGSAIDSRSFLSRILLHIADLPLRFFSGDRANWPTWSRGMIESAGKDENVDVLSRPTCQHVTETRDCLAEKQAVLPHQTDPVGFPTRDHLLLTSRERGLGSDFTLVENVDDVEALAWARERLLKWWDIPQEQRRRCQAAAAHARAENFKCRTVERLD